MTVRAMIVDDEPLARRGIRVRLERAGDIEILAECSSGHEAIARILELRPDLVFLDVQMPEIDGFGVVAGVGPEQMPVTVFVTAYETHALQAFEASALDYILKPIEDDRFDRALARARTRLGEKHDSERARRAAALAGVDDAPPPSRAPESRIAVRDRGRVVFVDVEDLEWIEAEGDYVRLHAGGRTPLLRATMAAMEQRLDPRRFMRVHRGAIVDRRRVRELRSLESGDHVVVMKSGAQVRLGRTYRARVEELLALR